MHDDHVRRQLTAVAPNRLWLTDLTGRPTAGGKLYLCAIKDVYAGRIVGYSMAGRMQASLAVDALEQAVARLGGTGITWIERTYHRRRGQARLGRLTPVESKLIMDHTTEDAA